MNISETKPITSILVIDDDDDEFELVSEAVSEIDPAISVSFLDRCDRVSQYKDKQFDLVLLDINMPFHDGFDWLKGIREKGLADLPVIMYTNSLYPGHISKAYQEGANLYFVKPDNFNSLVKGLRKLMSLNWTNPFLIKENHFQNGKFIPFQVD